MADGEELNDEREMERTMLHAVYADDLDCSSGATHALRCRIRPRAAETRARAVTATVAVELPSAYPHEPPAVSIVDARGLIAAEELRLQSELSARAAELVGEPSLYALFEHACDVLTEINHSGDCPICLEPLFECDERATFLTPCSHTFHSLCVGRWWHAYQPPARAESSAQPAQADAADAAAKAAEAELRVLEEKLRQAEAATAAARKHHANLPAGDEPASASALRRGEEDLNLTMEVQASLIVRVKRAVRRVEDARRVARTVSVGQSESRAALPLPCPACREPIPRDALERAAVQAEAPPHETQHVPVPPSLRMMVLPAARRVLPPSGVQESAGAAEQSPTQCRPPDSLTAPKATRVVRSIPHNAPTQSQSDDDALSLSSDMRDRPGGKRGSRRRRRGRGSSAAVLLE